MVTGFTSYSNAYWLREELQMFVREKYINEITKQLAWISTTVELLDSLNLNSINVHAESFFCGLLNTVFGYQLHDLNATEMNYTSIDLGDEKNKIAIQVTSEKTSAKIRKTLEKFCENEYYKKYDRLIIFIIGKKPDFSATFEHNGKIEFLKERDIWDTKYLINQIGGKENHSLSLIAEYLNSQLLTAKGYTGVDPIPIVEATRKKAYGLCMAKLQSIGVVPELAQKIIETDVASTKYQYILDSVNAGRIFLTGDYGTGKSHALLILAQRVANEFLKATRRDIPLFAHARDFVGSGSIQQWIDNLEIGTYSYFLFIDGLDEIDSSVAKRLLEEIDVLSAINVNNRILVGSRPISALTCKMNKLVVTPLSVEEQCILYSMITGECEVKARFSHLEAQMQLMLSKPFFCIIYALFKAEPKSWAKTDMDLVAAFVDRALKDVDENASVLYHDLSTLAAKSIDRNLAGIHVSDIRLQGRLDLMLKTGFVSQSGDYLSFSLPIIAQWMAAEAIRLKIIRIEDIICDKARTSRWLYALSILFSQMTFEESLDYFSMIVQTMPGVASRIIRDGLRFGQAKSLPSAYECGKKLQECMKVWISALGPLSHYIAPIDATDPLPLVVGAQDGRIAFSWRKGKMNSSVTTMSIRELVHTQGACQIRGVPAQSTWPWIITFEYLSDKLKKVIKGHTIITSEGQLEREFFWDTALHIVGKGRLYEGEISFESLEKYRRIPKGILDLNGKYIYIDSFYKILDKYIAKGINSIKPPYPVSDKKCTSGWIWAPYSAQRYLEKVQFTYGVALDEYMSIVETAFPTLKDCLQIAQLSPCQLVGKLEFHEDGKNYSDAPGLTWYLEALPYDESNRVDIQFKKAPISDLDLLTSLHKKNSNLRSEFMFHSLSSITNQTLRIICSTPVTDLVYNWLESELKTIGWLK